MPFRTYAEMRAMLRKDPEQAKEFVQHAKEKGLPVVSKDNPGYSSAAKRRMTKMMSDSRNLEKEESTQKIMSNRNKRIGY